MNTSNYIIFKKQRELGQIVSDTFVFLRRNLKPLFKVLAKTCSIPFLLLIIAVGFYTKISAGLDFFSVENMGQDVGSFIIAIIALGTTGIIYNAMLYGSVSEYIKAYIATGDKPNKAAVVNEIKKKTGSFIGLGFVNLLIFLAAILIPAALGSYLFASGSESLGILLLFLSFFPVLYLYVRFSVIYPTISNQETSTTETFSLSGQLVKGEWWMTFITIFIIAILIGIIGFVFQIPVAIYTFIKTFTSMQSGSMSNPKELFDGVYLVLQIIASSVNYLLYVILAICVNFIYFNLNERKNQSGSLDQIDQIGSKNE
ncbi:hypothetical protein [Dokdonia sp. Hel_I_53]|uniref:hypothetical protein n=1 Tax=Dokdonia sp. Hel_I_53 TaxID=1566287 RepID=UPI0011994DA0|nr:hypothetical protein [Dokdonia sp. Hel_I_53]TVZ51125.1 hypothetical protein OD90_0261 [Dokdonia sp. Hel_I_53]